MMGFMDVLSICSAVALTAAGAARGVHLLRRTIHSPELRITPSQDESGGRPAPGAWHEPRYGKRHAVNCPIEYVLGETKQEGMLVDMSRRGWRVRATHQVARGTPIMRLRIRCFDSVQDLTIDEAVVRWTDGQEFGMQVTRITPEAAERLSNYLTLHYPTEDLAPFYALVPVSYSR